MSGVTQELGFMDTVEERKPGFFQQVKQFMKDTDGGAVPVSVAVVALGMSKSHVYRLIEKEIAEPGTGLRAKKFNSTILVYAKDIDRIADEEKRSRGRPKVKGK